MFAICDNKRNMNMLIFILPGLHGYFWRNVADESK
uniref:Uncharacterized protein n=1 Tax=Anguilla anguilla TaxID=7936 RepID=A0A0E9PXP6_ANGAN